MEVDPAAYPPLHHLKRNYNDDEKRVQWRSKQAVDFAFMFSFAKDLSKYYLQIEDDVISSQSLIPKIKDGINKEYHPWVTLEFATLGFIGVLYKTEDLERLSDFLLMFYMEQPVDWLYTYFFNLLAQKKRIIKTPALFQHFGRHSSLAEKSSRVNNMKKAYSNTLKEKTFQDPDPEDLSELGWGKNTISGYQYSGYQNTITASYNPSAKVFTSLEVHSFYHPENAYLPSSKFFWGKDVVVNSTFLVVFTRSLKLYSVEVWTGHNNYQSDYLHYGVLEYSRQLNGGESKQWCDPDTYHHLADFTFGKVSIRLPSASAKNARCLRVRATKEQKEWLIISSILVNGSGRLHARKWHLIITAVIYRAVMDRDYLCVMY